MKRFENSVFFQTLSRTLLILIFGPLLFASGCDMGTYNKRLQETTINQPDANKDRETDSNQQPITP